MTLLPPYLKPGDSIGLICPAGYMPLEKTLACRQALQAWGYQVRVGKTVGSDSENYFSGTDKQRLADLQEMLDDPAIRAVFCARGGYGLGRIVDQISFKAFRKDPKWIIGFSDVTVLHSHIFSRYKIASLHAPMASAFADGGSENEFVLSLKGALAGKRARYHCPAHPFNLPGKARGELVGGNLSLLTHLCGTRSEIRTKGKILFLEDVGEYRYQVDRMMYQLKRNGKLDQLAGLIIGGFTDIKDTERPFGLEVYELIREIIKEYPYPVCFGFPVSHGKENYALKVGVEYTLQVGKSETRLFE